MPPKDSIQLGAGTMYFGTPGGLKPLGAIQEIEFTEEAPELDIDGRTSPRIVAQSGEFSGTITLTAETCEALRDFAETAEAAVRVFKQLMENIKKLCAIYPHRRSKYLAAHHRDPLVRKKNVKRIVRFCKKLNRGDKR